MSLPPLAPLPPASIRLSLGPEEWEACLDAWLTLAELTLRLPLREFQRTVGNNGSLVPFLTSYYRELDSVAPGNITLDTTNAKALRKACFKLTRRALTETEDIPLPLLTLDFLSRFCKSHVRNAALQRLTGTLWKQKSEPLSIALQRQKETIVKTLESGNIDDSFVLIAQLAPVMHASADIGAFFMTGSDFLDSMNSIFAHATSDEQRKAITSVAGLGMLSLVTVEVPNLSSLSDHMYALKAEADSSQGSTSLLADVVTNTAVLDRLRRSLGPKTPERIFKLLDILETYRSSSIARPRKRTARKKQSKGKARDSDLQSTLHVHRLSLVTQIQDMFPDLGSGFVLKLLDEYEDNVEQVTAHLLDDSLPSHLASLDRSEQTPVSDMTEQAGIDHLAPQSTPPPLEPYVPDRRNAFDDDELDELDFATGKLHIGKQSRRLAPDTQPNKAAILSALAAFDADDDERDDTYDVEDVGGTVDTPHPDGEPGIVAKVTQDENDMALFTAYRSSPELFGRTFNIRRGQPRAALKKETGMTDEAIEGWAIMLQREPKRLKRLEAQLGSFDGRQTELAGTAYRESAAGTETEDSDVPGGAASGGRGGFRDRGLGRGGRGGWRGGGSVAGPSNDQSTANAQRRKEANKGSKANHNRRDQRARKMARGGFPG